MEVSCVANHISQFHHNYIRIDGAASPKISYVGEVMRFSVGISEGLSTGSDIH